MFDIDKLVDKIRFTKSMLKSGDRVELRNDRKPKHWKEIKEELESVQ
jgi:hypothetical protein